MREKRCNQSDKVAKAIFEHIWFQISAVYLATYLELFHLSPVQLSKLIDLT